MTEKHDEYPMKFALVFELISCADVHYGKLLESKEIIDDVLAMVASLIEDI